MAILRISALLLVCCVGLAAAQNATISTTWQPVSNLAQRRQFPGEALRFTFGSPTTPAVNNSAALQYVDDVTNNPVLATVSGSGISQTTVRMAACGILLPHVHPRGTEALFVINGTVSVGIAEENGGRIINFDVGAFQNYVAPVGLVHYAHNNNCQPVFFTQSFNSADPGTISLPRALLAFPADAVTASYNQTPDQIAALNATLPTPTGAFTLDQRCIARCSAGSNSTATSG